MKYLVNLCRTPTAAEIAQRELAEAQRDLLRYQAAQEFAKHMADCQAARVRRLTTYLADVL